MPSIRCPHCEAEDPRVVQIVVETVRTSYPVSLVEVDGRLHDGIDGEAEEREIIDADRDDAKFRCEECLTTFDGEELSDFLCDNEDEGDEAGEGVRCPMGCEVGTPQELLGTLGSREHYRCRACGITHNAAAEVPA